MEQYIKHIENEYILNSNPVNAVGQKAYMKNQFEYYGISTPVRRAISKPFLQKEFLPEKKDLDSIVKILWQKPQREFQYFSQELVEKFKNNMSILDIKLFEFMILNKSWWDTIDFIAPKLVGEYFKKYPKERDKKIEKWIESGNIWLQRSSILFQLKYKNDLDFDFLSYVINSLLGSKEFFINKAIGWILRDHSRISPNLVIDFVENTKLSSLSKKEALRLLNK